MLKGDGSIDPPCLTISLILRCPYANTIAFGGVATGNRKAKLAAMVAGSIR